MPIQITENYTLLNLNSDSSQADIIKVLDDLKYNEKFNELSKIAAMQHIGGSTAILSNLAKIRLFEALAIAITKLDDEKLNEIANGAAYFMAWQKVLCNNNDYIISASEAVNFLIICNIQKTLRKETITPPEVTQGPLPENKASKLLAFIYTETNKNNATYKTNNRNEILVTINQQEFNISYLLGEADLTQFLIHSNSESSDGADQEVTLLNDEIVALQNYTGEKYKEINLLLRTGKLKGFIADPKSIFMQACNIAHALNKYSWKVENDLLNRFEIAKLKYLALSGYEPCPDRKYLPQILIYSQSQGILTLAECNKLVEFHFLGSIRKSDFVPDKLGFNEGFMSSAQGKIADSFVTKTHTVWSNQGMSVRALSVYDREAEVMTQSGRQHYFTRGDDKVVYAFPINTPSLIKPKDYPWLRAVQVSHDEYLSKPYQDIHLSSADLKFQGIERPNHGLAHTIRKIHYVEPVITFFAKHAKNVVLRKIFKKLTHDECDKLKITMAFYVSGRQSEVSFRTHDEDITRYRNASVANFKKHVEQDPLWTKKEIEKYSQLLIYYKEDFRNHKLFCLDKIVDLCHQLDLARCYGAAEMKEAVDERCLPEKSPDLNAAKEDWITLKKWSIECIRATGDRLVSQVDANGDYVSATQSYVDTTFQKASRDPLDCLKLLRAGPLAPSFTETPPNQLSVVQVSHFQYQEAAVSMVIAVPSYAPAYSASAHPVTPIPGFTLKDKYNFKQEKLNPIFNQNQSFITYAIENKNLQLFEQLLNKKSLTQTNNLSSLFNPKEKEATEDLLFEKTVSSIHTLSKKQQAELASFILKHYILKKLTTLSKEKIKYAYKQIGPYLLHSDIEDQLNSLKDSLIINHFSLKLSKYEVAEETNVELLISLLSKSIVAFNNALDEISIFSNESNAEEDASNLKQMMKEYFSSGALSDKKPNQKIPLLLKESNLENEEADYPSSFLINIEPYTSAAAASGKKLKLIQTHSSSALSDYKKLVEIIYLLTESSASAKKQSAGLILQKLIEIYHSLAESELDPILNLLGKYLKKDEIELTITCLKLELKKVLKASGYSSVNSDIYLIEKLLIDKPIIDYESSITKLKMMISILSEFKKLLPSEKPLNQYLSFFSSQNKIEKISTNQLLHSSIQGYFNKCGY